MKAFVCTAILFTLLLGGAIVNSLLLDKTTSDLLSLTDEFPVKAEDGSLPPDPTIREVEEIWDRQYRFLALSANQRYLTAVVTALNNVIDYYENGSVSDYLAAKSQLIEALKSLRHSDALRWESVI